MASTSVHVFRKTGGSFLVSASRLLTQQHAAVGILPCKRYLFSHEILGLDNYQRQRLMMIDRLGDLKSKFLQRMNVLISGENKGTIFTDDLKTMLHVASNDEEINIMENMLSKYYQQVDTQRYNNYFFGPVVLRLLYTMKKTDLALELFQSEATKGLFTQIASYILMMDMLYECKRYDDVLKVYSQVNQQETGNFKYPTDCTIIVLASLYALNTSEALQQTQELMVKCLEANVSLSSRGIVFAAMLALKQEQPDVGLEMLSAKDDTKLIVLKNVKAICYARLGRVEDTFPILRSILQHDSPYKNRQMKIFPDVLSVIKLALNDLKDPVLQQHLETIEVSLKNGALIGDIPLEDFIVQVITRPRRVQNSFKSRERSTIGGYRSRESNPSRSYYTPRERSS